LFSASFSWCCARASAFFITIVSFFDFILLFYCSGFFFAIFPFILFIRIRRSARVDPPQL
ncbi:hypothetical protein, partial [Thiolapillus sp.]|uniref:hypothetical protein n=1 Tax=Thiolapillus sp. TaxID=2017437 RepID=UPI003AF86E19